MYLLVWTGLAVTLMYNQCTSNAVGCYAKREITKFTMQLALTLMYGQHTTDGIGCYV